MVDVVTVVGARPQFIKCAPVSRALREKFSEFIIHTGQHYDQEMSEVFFRELGIPQPDINLQVGSGNHGYQTGQMLMGIEDILVKHNPKIVLVYGDTNSTLAGALAAVKLHIPVAHVEAGLRSYDRSMPEEINRVMVDHVSSLLFCPTEIAVENLKKEGISRDVMITGDVMVDSIFLARDRILSLSPESENGHGIKKNGYYLATVHRPSNTDNPGILLSIMKSFNTLSYPVLFPIHPRTSHCLDQIGFAYSEYPNIIFISPQSYSKMVNLLIHARAVITDSGGLQKEAYIIGVPCATLRENTEWKETIEDGWNELIGFTHNKLQNVLMNFEKYPPKKHENRYGDGNASKRICHEINLFLKNQGC